MPEPSAILQNLPLLQFLPPNTREVIAASFTPEHFTFGSTIVREGDEASAFYVLLSGRARVLKHGDQNEEIPLNVLRPGDSFGEMALLNHSTRTASVRASTDVEALRLDRSVLDTLVSAHPDIRRYLEFQIKERRLHNFFRHYTAFARLPIESLTALVSDLETIKVGPGEIVVRQGDAAGPMYIVEDGRLRVFVDQNTDRQYVGYLRKGDFFGEMSLFSRAPRSASVETVSACQLLKLSERTFDKLVASVPEFKKEIADRIAQYDYKHVARVPLDFAEELLPAEVSAHEKAGPSQLDEDDASRPRSPAEQLGPFASAEGHFVKRARKIRRFPHVRQIDAMDCGAASLAMVCRFFGRSVGLVRIRQLVHTSQDGTSLRAICRAATELGLAARSAKVSLENLDQMPLPAIAHWQGNHWLVLYHIDRKHAYIADPATGLRRLTRREFEKDWSRYVALFDYTKDFDRAPEKQSSAAWLWPFLKPFSGLIAKAVALAAIISGLQLVIPLFTQVLVDRVLVDQDVALLNILVLGMLGTLVFMTLAMVVQRYLLSFAAVRVDASTLDFLTRKMLALPMNYFSTRRTGDIQRRLEGVKQIRDFLLQRGVTALSAVAELVAAVALMFVYSPLLGFVFLACTPLYVGLMVYSARRLRPMFDSLEEAFGKYNSAQIDAIKGIETVKAMAAERPFRDLMLNQFHKVASRVFSANFTMTVYEGAIQTVTVFSMILFLWVGAYQVMRGQLTIGALVAFNALVGMANVGLNTLLGLWDNLQLISVLLNRLDDVLDQEPEQGTDRSRLIPVRTLEGRVSCRNMGFRYGGPEAPPILEGITFDVQPGRTVAIVGRSGSGKTTLIKCLAGLLEPTEGSITYDGVDLKSLNYRQLRRQIGFVLQENHLFDDTIARNIGFGDDEPDFDRVMWASRVANAHEFIDRLPLGYDTKIGESGLAISGGQRQRVAIARAVYHRPPILIFDEATSALDTESERAVKENLDSLLAQRTSFVIAHRLSTVRDASVIFVLEKGKLVEQGTHDELMKRQGLYFYLCSQQLEL